MLYARGKGEFDVALNVSAGQFAAFIPIEMDPERDSLTASEDGKSLQWVSYPGARTKALYFQISPANAVVHLDFKKNGSRTTDMIFVGARGAHPPSLPFDSAFCNPPLDPVIVKIFRPKQDGLHVMRHGVKTPSARPGRIEPLDEQTIQQLRSLGYVR